MFTLQHQLLLISDCMSRASDVPPLKREQNSQVTPLLSTWDTRKTTSSWTQVFSGGMFPCRGHFCVLSDLQEVAALTGCHALDCFISFLRPPSGKEIQAVLLCRYFPLEKKLLISNQVSFAGRFTPSTRSSKSAGSSTHLRHRRSYYSTADGAACPGVRIEAP